MHFDFNPVLEDDLLLIRPLTCDDFDALFRISADPLLWEQHPAKERSTREGFEKWFEEAMATGKALFVEEKVTGKTVGTSRYREVEGDPGAIEIGWTFISREFWGKGYNAAVKKLMVSHAFSRYGTVLFFVDKQNFRSQKAVEKLGAKQIQVPEEPGFQERGATSFIYALNRVEIQW